MVKPFSHRSSGAQQTPIYLRIIPLLPDVPIRHPFVEKCLIEGCLFLSWVEHLYGDEFEPVWISEEAARARTIEVYRRCYASSTDEKRARVLRDFVEHFPHLVFKADWVAELVRRYDNIEDTEDTPKATAIMSKDLFAIAKGFSSLARSIAASEWPLQKRKLAAAWACSRHWRGELETWWESLERLDATSDWLDKQAATKAKALVKGNPKLEPHIVELTNLIRKGQFYQASNWMAAKAFGVRERLLQQRYPRPSE